MRKDRAQFIDADHINPVSTINALLIQMRVIEEEPTKIVRQRYVGVEVEPPAVVLEPCEADIQRGPLVELPAVFAKQVRLDADGPVLLSDLLGAPVLVACYNDKGVELRVVQTDALIKKVIEPNTSSHGFEAEGLGGMDGVGGRVSVHDQPAMSNCRRLLGEAILQWKFSRNRCTLANIVPLPHRSQVGVMKTPALVLWIAKVEGATRNHMVEVPASVSKILPTHPFLKLRLDILACLLD